MTSRALRPALLGVAAVVGVVGGVGATAVTSSASTGQVGFYVTGNGRASPLPLGVHVMDASGGQHVVVKARHGVYKYNVKQRGGGWTHTRIPGRYDAHGFLPVLTTVANGRRVALFEGQKIAEASARSTTLPRPRPAPVKACIPSTDPFWSVDDALPLPHDRMLMLVDNDDFDAPPSTADWQVLCVGRIGGSLHRIRIPRQNPLVVSGLMRDESTGRITLVGTGDCKHPGLFVWTSRQPRHWRPPVRIGRKRTQNCHRDGSHASLQVGLASIAAAQGRTWIGMDLYRKGGLRHRGALLEGSADGSWSRMHRTGNTPPTFDLLSANQTTGALHVVYANHGGLRHQYLKHGKWSPARYLARSDKHLQPQDLQLTPQGHPVVGYLIEF